MVEPQDMDGFLYGKDEATLTYICKQGTAADHERGVLYLGPWEIYADGFCEHVRRCARALSMTGWPVHLRSTSHQRVAAGDDRLIDEQYADLLRATIASYVVQVQQVVPTPNLLARLVTHRHYSAGHLAAINARRVLSTVWERTRGLAADDVAALSMCGQAWVATPMHAQMLVAEGVPEHKVRVVPCPYLPDDPHLALAGRKRMPGPVRFYHIGKWEPRKEQRNILRAFMLAFAPEEAVLMLKTSPAAPKFERYGSSYPSSPQEALLQCLEDDRVVANGWTEANLSRGIFVYQKRFTEQQMNALHRMGDVYVSLSRGEGFDMPALDAKLSGNALLYTPSGGTQEFADAQDFRVDKTGEVPCDPFYGWAKGARYIDYDIEEAVGSFRAAAEGRSAVARDVPLRIQQCFSVEVVGKTMRRYLSELMEDGEMDGTAKAKAE